MNFWQENFGEAYKSFRNLSYRIFAIGLSIIVFKNIGERFPMTIDIQLLRSALIQLLRTPHPGETRLTITNPLRYPPDDEADSVCDLILDLPQPDIITYQVRTVKICGPKRVYL